MDKDPVLRAFEADGIVQADPPAATCPGPHGANVVYRAWQHTEECRAARRNHS